MVGFVVSPTLANRMRVQAITTNSRRGSCTWTIQLTIAVAPRARAVPRKTAFVWVRSACTATIHVRRSLPKCNFHRLMETAWESHRQVVRSAARRSAICHIYRGRARSRAANRSERSSRTTTKTASRRSVAGVQNFRHCHPFAKPSTFRKSYVHPVGNFDHRAIGT